MSASDIAQSLLPTLVPIFAGYAITRWVGNYATGLRIFLRYAVVPALIFVVLLAGFKQEILFKLIATGIAMGLAGYFLVHLLPKPLGMPIDAGATMPNILCFALPFLALSWDTKNLGIRAAVLLFVTVAATLRVAEARTKAAKSLTREPWAYAALAALVFNLLEIPTAPLAKSVSLLAQTLYPLGLLVLGATLHPVSSADFRDKGAWVAIGLRWLAGFGTAILAVFAFKFAGGIRDAVIIVGLAPPATAALFMASSADGGNRRLVVVGTAAALMAMVVLFAVER